MEELRTACPGLSATPEDHASAPRLARGSGSFILEGTSPFFCNQDVADKLLTPETASVHFWESYLLTALSGREESNHHAPRPAFGFGPGDVIVARGALLLDQRAKDPWTKSMEGIDSASCTAGLS